MLMSGTLHRLLLAGTCLCVYGNPVHLPKFTPTQDSSCDGQCASSVTTHPTESKLPDTEDPNGPILNVGAGGGAGSHGRRTGPEGIALVTQTENGDSLDGRSGPSVAGGESWSQSGEVKKVGGASQVGAAHRQSEADSVLSADPESTKEPVLTPTGERKQSHMSLSTPRLTPDGFSASSAAPVQMEASSLSKELTLEKQKNNQSGEDRTKLPEDGDSLQGKDTETSWPSSTEPSNPSEAIQRLTSHSPIPPSVFTSPRTSLSMWSHDGATISTLPDPLLPEIGPNLVPREDGLESLWTEAARPSGVDTVVPLSQDEATEGTMSSEALPLIFEPFEDVTPEGAGPAAAAAVAAAVTLVPGSPQPPAAMVTGGMPLSEVDLDQLVTVESDGPSQAPPLLMPDWTSSWQTSGAELPEPISTSVSQRGARTEPGLSEDPSDKDTVRTPNLEENLPTSDPSLSSFQHAMTTVTMATRQPVHKSRSGLEEMESEEEPDEDEEDENSEESVEEESDEDLTETPKASSTQPPYSLIPPPPVWVQRNQGLMRSWVELIREKAGYVSGMLAPVGIGITGALLIVGALYSIRMIHRKRRNSFKHQRRKVRQPEQPREPGTSRQDQAMLLADSSEDEF